MQSLRRLVLAESHLMSGRVGALHGSEQKSKLLRVLLQTISRVEAAKRNLLSVRDGGPLGSDQQRVVLQHIWITLMDGHSVVSVSAMWRGRRM